MTKANQPALSEPSLQETPAIDGLQVATDESVMDSAEIDEAIAPLSESVPESERALMAAAEVASDQSLLGGYAYQIIRQQSKRMAKLRSQVLKDTDPEALHQMRISSRRLRSALTLFSDAVVMTDVMAEPHPKKQHQKKQRKQRQTEGTATIAADKATLKLAKSLVKLTKALGKVRDFDVMQVWIEQALTAGKKGQRELFGTSLKKSEKKTLKALNKALKGHRKKAFKSLKKFLKGEQYVQLTKRVKQWVKAPAFTLAAEQVAYKDAAERIIAPITKLLRHPGWLVGTRSRYGQITPIQSITLPKLNRRLADEGELLHELRKQIKQVRYQAEFFRSLYGITYASQVREFRTLQTILGELQDQIVISQCLRDELGEDWAEQLPTIYNAFQNSRLSHWQQWQPYQQKYLKLRCSLPAGTAVVS